MMVVQEPGGAQCVVKDHSLCLMFLVKNAQYPVDKQTINWAHARATAQLLSFWLVKLVQLPHLSNLHMIVGLHSRHFLM
jgi:hypothetical protein